MGLSYLLPASRAGVIGITTFVFGCLGAIGGVAQYNKAQGSPTEIKNIANTMQAASKELTSLPAAQLARSANPIVLHAVKKCGAGSQPCYINFNEHVLLPMQKDLISTYNIKQGNQLGYAGKVGCALAGVGFALSLAATHRRKVYKSAPRQGNA